MEVVLTFGIYTVLQTQVDPGRPMVIILATGSEVRGLKPGRSRSIFSDLINSEYAFLRKGSEAVGPVSYIYGT